jgi:hypothetical protein
MMRVALTIAHSPRSSSTSEAVVASGFSRTVSLPSQAVVVVGFSRRMLWASQRVVASGFSQPCTCRLRFEAVRVAVLAVGSSRPCSGCMQCDDALVAVGAARVRGACSRRDCLEEVRFESWSPASAGRVSLAPLGLPRAARCLSPRAPRRSRHSPPPSHTPCPPIPRPVPLRVPPLRVATRSRRGACGQKNPAAQHPERSVPRQERPRGSAEPMYGVAFRDTGSLLSRHLRAVGPRSVLRI